MAIASAEVTPSTATRGDLILLVDDDLRTARRVAEMLREDGFEVELANNGARAISRLARLPLPDLIVSALQLPEADGVAVGRFARSLRPGMPIVIATNYPELFAPQLFGEPKPVLLVKPIAYGQLRDTISAVLPLQQVAPSDDG